MDRVSAVPRPRQSGLRILRTTSEGFRKDTDDQQSHETCMRDGKLPWAYGPSMHEAESLFHVLLEVGSRDGHAPELGRNMRWTLNPLEEDVVTNDWLLSA